MSLVVETTSAASGTNTSSIVVTKPVSVDIGDLLVIVVGGGGAAAPSEDIRFSCSGFTSGFANQNDPGGSTSVSSVEILYKIADSSDVSASNYTVTTGARFVGGVAMFRISGWVAGNPVYNSASSGVYQDGGITIADTISIPRLGQQLLIMFGNTITTSSEGGVFSFASYQVTSTDSNPTWTELIDANYYASTSNARFFCAYALSSDVSTLTQYGFIKTGDSVANEETTVYALACIFTPVSVNASNALFQVSPISFTALTGSTQELLNDFHEITPDIFEQSASSTNPTQWTAESKPSTSWEN